MKSLGRFPPVSVSCLKGKQEAVTAFGSVKANRKPGRAPQNASSGGKNETTSQEVKLGEMPEQLGSPPISSPSFFYGYGFLDLVLVKEKVSFVS